MKSKADIESIELSGKGSLPKNKFASTKLKSPEIPSVNGNSIKSQPTK